MGYGGTVLRVNYHDATLVGIDVNWAAGTFVVGLRPVGAPELQIRGVGMSNAVIPRRQPWGPSISVNQLLLSDSSLTIEMQSGDTLMIEAKQINVIGVIDVVELEG